MSKISTPPHEDRTGQRWMTRSVCSRHAPSHLARKRRVRSLPYRIQPSRKMARKNHEYRHSPPSPTHHNTTPGRKIPVRQSDAPITQSLLLLLPLHKLQCLILPHNHNTRALIPQIPNPIALLRHKQHLRSERSADELTPAKRIVAI